VMAVATEAGKAFMYKIRSLVQAGIEEQPKFSRVLGFEEKTSAVQPASGTQIKMTQTKIALRMPAHGELGSLSVGKRVTCTVVAVPHHLLVAECVPEQVSQFQSFTYSSAISCVSLSERGSEIVMAVENRVQVRTGQRSVEVY
jgi:hypothetical protein